MNNYHKRRIIKYSSLVYINYRYIIKLYDVSYSIKYIGQVFVMK